MDHTWTAPGEEKPVLSYGELLQQNAEANLKRMKHDLAREHILEGCPVDRGFAACVFHGINGVEEPLPGWPKVPR